MQQNLVVIPFEQLESMIANTVNTVVLARQTAPVPKREPIRMEKLMTIQEVAQFFHRSRQTIHAWKRKGLIPFHRISRKIYFKQSEIEESLRKIEISRR